MSHDYFHILDLLYFYSYIIFILHVEYLNKTSKEKSFFSQSFSILIILSHFCPCLSVCRSFCLITQTFHSVVAPFSLVQADYNYVQNWQNTDSLSAV